VSARGAVAALIGFGWLLAGAAPAPLAAAKAPKPEWTPDQVRRFVLGVERLMDGLYLAQAEGEHPELAGTCRGYPMSRAIKRSVALSRMHGFVGGKALRCYLATYLGCDAGPWIGRPTADAVGPELRPFKRAKVTIVEQTPDRVVADVTEIPTDDLFDGDAKVYLGEDDVRPYTEAEIAGVKDASRYTITRVNGWMWQITDRKPSFPWVCNGSLDQD
jgi:hypothetical protein